MKRSSTVILSAAVVAALFVALAASCGPPAEPAKVVPPTPAPESTPSASAPVAKAVNLDDPSAIAASAWDDDDVIQALAKDCHWDPGGCLKAIEAQAPQSVDGMEYAPEGPPGKDSKLPPAVCKPLWPLACAKVPGQSCAPDACSQTDYTCVPACDKTCGTCATGCVAGCDTCKSACKDDACRLTCAKSCAACRTACLTKLDHCASAGCSDEAENCFKTRDDEWNKSACPKVCPRVAKCVEKCPEIENDYSGERFRSECANKCLSKLGKGCPESFSAICAGDPNAGVNFFAYHEAQKSEPKKNEPKKNEPRKGGGK